MQTIPAALVSQSSNTSLVILIVSLTSLVSTLIVLLINAFIISLIINYLRDSHQPVILQRVVAAVAFSGHPPGKNRSIHREYTRRKVVKENMHHHNPGQCQHRFITVGHQGCRDDPAGQETCCKDGKHENEP